jgi:hypoxanthine phosphoribosyltransferase
MRKIFPAARYFSRLTASYFDKPSRRKADIAPDYEGFAVPDEFVVGYGLDYDEKYRNLPYIGVLKPSVYEK